MPGGTINSLLCINQHAGQHVTGAIGANWDKVNVQPGQPSPNCSGARSVNPSLLIFYYINASHETIFDRNGTFGTYSPVDDPAHPLASWFLYDIHGNKISAGAGFLMNPKSTASDGHGHNGWPDWRKASAAYVSGLSAPDAFDSVWWDVLGLGSSGENKAVDPSTGLIYTKAHWLADWAAFGTHVAAGWAAQATTQVGNGLQSAHSFDPSNNDSGLICPDPLWWGQAEQFLRQPYDALSLFPSNPAQGTGTYAQNLAMIQAQTAGGKGFQGNVKLWNGSGPGGSTAPSGPSAATTDQIDQWTRVGMGLLLCGMTAAGTCDLCVATWQGDITPHPLIAAPLGAPAAALIQNADGVWEREFTTGYVVLNTNAGAKSYTFPSVGGPWTDYGTSTVYHHGDVISLPGDYALILTAPGSSSAALAGTISVDIRLAEGPATALSGTIDVTIDVGGDSTTGIDLEGWDQDESQKFNLEIQILGDLTFQTPLQPTPPLYGS